MPEATTVVHATNYFGPVFFYYTLNQAETVYIEQHEHFIRQTYRNRCLIQGSNGVLPLIVPVEKGRTPQQKIRDLRIAYHTPWQRNQWRSIVSAYKNSPFFDDYQADIQHYFEKEFKFLFDLNMSIMNTMCQLLNLNTDIRLTQAFENSDAESGNFRTTLSPKIPLEDTAPWYSPVEYTQVFEDKFQFMPGLSILDLLFCCGSGAIGYLGQKITDKS